MFESPSTVVIGGLTGSGKSLAIQQLEGLGFVGIDALPPPLVPQAIECYPAHCLAVSVDLRHPDWVLQSEQLGSWLRTQSIPSLFLEARDEILVQRLTAHRRRHHYLQDEGGVWEAIQRERLTLAGIRQQYSQVVDTSDLSAAQLRHTLQEWLQTPGGELQVTLVSFGFKFGVPLDANLMFDVRFLPNPFFDPQLRFLTGQDEQLQETLFRHEQTQTVFNQILTLIQSWLPSYRQEKRAHLTLAVGCTGGQHRSVAVVERLAQSLQDHSYPGIRFQVVHRHLQRSQQELHHRFGVIDDPQGVSPTRSSSAGKLDRSAAGVHPHG